MKHISIVYSEEIYHAKLSENFRDAPKKLRKWSRKNYELLKEEIGKNIYKKHKTNDSAEAIIK